MADLLPLNPDELLSTTRTVRKRLDLTRPVPRSLIEECLTIATQAPTGSNAQEWQWVFVEDQATKVAIAEIYREVFDAYVPGVQAAKADSPVDERSARQTVVASSAQYLRDHFHEVPVLMLPYLEGRPETRGHGRQPGFWGSILPAVWSFMLAARARGLGSAWTTMTCRREEEVAALIGVDPTRFTHVGTFPLAYTIGTDFKPGARIPIDGIIHWDRW